MAILISYINALTIFCLVLSMLMIILKGPDSPSKWPSIFFIYSIISYLVLDFLPKDMVRIAIFLGPLLLPFSFWVLSNSLFSDRPFRPGAIMIAALVVLAIYYLFSAFRIEQSSWLSRSFSVLFVVLAIYESQKQKGADLVERRRRIRNIFTYTSSTLVLLALVSELVLIGEKQSGLSKLIQRSSLLIFASYFHIANISMSDTFLGSYQKKSIVKNKNPELVDKIQEKVIGEKIYRKEALTIRQLADLLDEPEYKVRQAINQELGYRNFTDFINSFRIQEAKRLFSDHTMQDMTIIEVAYKVGFNSIRPFNRAFKLITNQTPTEYRKSI